MNYENPVFEGIGNEVIWGVLATLIVVVLTWFIIKRLHLYYLIETANQNGVAQQHIFNSSRLLNNDSEMTNAHYGSDQCPICLAEPRYPVETNCGHLFCTQCVITYWQHGTWMGAVRCPVCRQSVTVLLRCFRDRTAATEEERQELTDILFNINDYNRRFSGEPRPWLAYLFDLPTLLRHVGAEFFSVGGLIYMFRLRIVLCIIGAVMYLISPLDMIPEAVFGILGLVDDMFVVLLLAIYITVIYRRILATRWRDER